MRVLRSARSPLTLLAGVLSLCAGILLTFRLATPQAIDRLATAELVALLGLITLPAPTAWAFLADRRRSVRARRISGPAARRADALTPTPSLLTAPAERAA